MCHLWDVTHWHWVSRTEEGQAFAKQSVFFRGRNIATDYMTWITFDSIMPPYMFAQHLMHWSSLSLEPQDITVTQVLFMLATERQIMGEGREKAALLVDEFARYHFYNIEQLNRDATERFCLRSVCFHRDLWFAEFILIFMHFCGLHFLYFAWPQWVVEGELGGGRITVCVPSRALIRTEVTYASLFNPSTLSFH